MKASTCSTCAGRRGGKPGLVHANNGFAFDVANALAAQPADALWVPGGDPNQLSRIIHDPAQTYLDFLKMQAARGNWVCSVCEGAFLLAVRRLLDGDTVTTDRAFIPICSNIIRRPMAPPSPTAIRVSRSIATG